MYLLKWRRINRELMGVSSNLLVINVEHVVLNPAVQEFHYFEHPYYKKLKLMVWTIASPIFNSMSNHSARSVNIKNKQKVLTRECGACDFSGIIEPIARL